MAETIAHDPRAARLDLVLTQLDGAPTLPKSLQSLLISNTVGDARKQLVTGVLQSFAHQKLGFDQREFWLHGIAVGLAAELIAAKRSKTPVSAFAAGLLHDVGKIVLASVMPKSYERVTRIASRTQSDLLDIEETTLGIDHAAAGRRWSERQGLPAFITESIWLHHLPDDAIPANVTSLAIIQAVRDANVMAHRLNIGWSGQNTVSAAVDESELARISDELLRRIDQARPWIDSALDAKTSTITKPGRETGSLLDHDCLEAMDWLGRTITLRESVLETCALAAESINRVVKSPAAVFELDHETHSGRIGFANGPVASSEIIELAPAEKSPDQMIDEVDVHCRRHFGSAPMRRAQFPSASNSTSGAFFVAVADVDGAAFEILCRFAGQAIAQAHARETARKLTDQLVSAQRRQSASQGRTVNAKVLETVVAMAAGAAHELNNPLAVISGRAQMLAGKAVDEATRAEAEAISRQAQIASNIVTELMEFARPRPPVPESVSLQDTIRDVMGSLIDAGLLGNGQAIVEIPSDTPPVWFDREYLAGLFRELISNAIEATDPAARRLTVKAQSDPTEDGVVVAVIDNGRGMTPAVRAHALDPFFSWRPAGRGRGLGLSRVARWLAEGEGTLEIVAAAGGGTRVQVRLPIAEGRS